MSQTNAGAVYDRGYRPYDGPRLSRFGILRALWLASVRRALGLRRSWRQKLLPWLLLAIVTVPAMVQVGVAYLTRDNPALDFDFITYREYVGVSTALLLFVAITAPDVICPDRRQRVLPLILSRPMTGTGYALAKLAAIASIVFAFGLLPQMLLFIGQMLVASEGSLAYARDNAEVLWQVPVAVAVLALYYAAIGVGVASLTTKRVAGAAIFIGLMLVSGVVAGIISEVNQPEQVVVQESELPPLPPGAQVPDRQVFTVMVRENTMASIVNLSQLPLHVRDLVFLGHLAPDDDLGGVEGGGPAVLGLYATLVAAAVGGTILRYREAA